MCVRKKAMLKKIIYWFLFICISSNVCSSLDDPTVKTALGEIRGTWKTSVNGRTYAAFEGIPYAKPPLGELRFEEPQPVGPWSGIWDATSLYTCIQYISYTPQKQLIIGNEDCLYLNVFVPTDNILLQKNFDVLVNIHGGAFSMGSGHLTANPKFLMDKNMIVVTFNYRLGILGFLSTEDEAIPGNNGMKDQVLALKWVKEHIASFGGNPNSVTISGQSAGSASVHFHYLSPMSKGLFARGLSQSGTALDPWAIKEQPLESANKLAALVGCGDSSTQELKKCLKKLPATLLLKKMEYFYSYDWLPLVPFSPVIEKNTENPFLAENPFVMLQRGDILNLPWIVSICADDGLLPSAWYYTNLETLESKWSEVAHYFLDYNYTLPTSKREEAAKLVKEFYLGPGEHFTAKNFKKFTQIFTDRVFGVGAQIAAQLQSKANKSLVYFYFFNYSKGENKALLLYSNEKGIEGVAHGEDSIYFYGSFTSREYSERDKNLKNICQDLLYSYVTTGKPSSHGISEWQPTGASELTYLNITDADDIKIQTTKSLAPVKFWKNLGCLEYEHLSTVKVEL